MIRPVTTHTPTLHRRLREAADQLTEGPVSLAHLARVHGSAMHGTLLVLLATPCVLPIPGIGNVLGLALMAMALALWRGDDCSTLPRRIAEIELSAQWARRVLTILARAYEWAGRWSRQRLVRLVVVRRRSWLAGNLGLMGGVIFLPIPLGNVLPALAVVLLGLGLALGDGLAVIAGWVVAAAAVTYTVAVCAGAWIWLIAPLGVWLR